MRILMIGGSASRKAFGPYLKSQSNAVDTLDTGSEGIEVGRMFEYDVIMVDTDLPDMSGIEAIRCMRQQRVVTPIVAVATGVNVEARIEALNAGADDCLVRPCHDGEMLARLNAVVRRSQGVVHPVITIGELVIDTGGGATSFRGVPIRMTSKEQAVLHLMAVGKGRPIMKQTFMSNLYSEADEPELKIIDVFVCKVRKKLAAHGCEGYIETVWGRGYMLREPVEVERTLQISHVPATPIETLALPAPVEIELEPVETTVRRTKVA